MYNIVHDKKLDVCFSFQSLVECSRQFSSGTSVELCYYGDVVGHPWAPNSQCQPPDGSQTLATECSVVQPGIESEVLVSCDLLFGNM